MELRFIERTTTTYVGTTPEPSMPVTTKARILQYRDQLPDGTMSEWTDVPLVVDPVERVVEDGPR